ncbi:MAG: outer membrane beta-barrel protein [Desulfoplanes sp.]|nr:outer membrane beta-barrel protein [Desulfoplanes sp.]
MICIMGAVFFAQGVLAAGNIQIGQVKVLPRVSYTGEWEDNIYQDNANKKNDYLHKLGAGLGLEYTRDEDNYARLSYDVTHVRYDEYSKNDYWKHNALASLRYQSPMGMYVTLSENFRESSDPYDSDDDYDTGDITKRWINDAKVGLGYEFSDRIRTEAYYRNYLKRFHEFSDKHKDRMEHEPGIITYYKFLPKTSVLVEYRATFTSYAEQQDASDNAYGYDSDTSQDSTYHRVFVGLHWDATAKINGDLKLGWGYKDFDNDEDYAGNDYKDKGSWVAETRLGYQLFQRTRLTFSLVNEQKDDTDAGTGSYEHSKVGFGLDQGITDQLKFLGDVSYTYNLYEYEEDGTNDKDENIYSLGLGFKYAFNEWVNAGIGYTYKEKINNSSYDSDNYTDHTCSISLGAAF